MIALTMLAALASPPFAQLPTHGAAARISWSWPDAGQFQDRLEAEAAPVELVAGQLRWQQREGAAKWIAARLAAGERLSRIVGQGEARFGLVSHAAAPSGEATLSYDDLSSGRNLGAQSWVRHADGDLVVFAGDSGFLLVSQARSAPAATPGGQAWQDWVYATTLMNSDPPVYGPQRGKNRGTKAADTLWPKLQRWMKQPKLGLKKVRAADLSVFGDRDRRLATLAVWLEGQGDRAGAIELRERFTPVGRCSMDRAPAFAMERYGDLCFQDGRIGCFLQLQVRVMGDRFERAIWSSYGEAAADTRVGRLSQAGIDVRRFLRGLLVDYAVDGRKGEWIGRWRLVRAMKESGLQAEFTADLERLAQDPELDGLNRLRATQALWLMLRRAESQDAATVAAHLAPLKLTDIGRTWVAQIEQRAAR